MKKSYNVYVVMNDMGIHAVFGHKKDADKRSVFIQGNYLMKHWVETWEVEAYD